MIDVTKAILEVMRAHGDKGETKELMQEVVAIIASEIVRPSVLYRPGIFPDGTKWCALYGDDLVIGVCGFGDTPQEAMSAFDEAWRERKTPDVTRCHRANS